MKKTGARSALLAVVALPLAACQQESAEVEPEPVVLKSAMEEVITPETQAVLDVLIAALDANAEIDPELLSDEDWVAMEAAAVRLRDEVMAMRDDEVQVVAAPGEPIEGEENPGALSAADVQARIDANPADFKAHAGALLAEAERLVTASRARDAATMWEVGLNLDPLCAECHEQFWYPEPPS